MSIQSIVKNVFLQAWRMNYFRKDRRNAKSALHVLERQGAVVSSVSRKKCDEYAVGVLGGSQFAPWLYVFTAIAGEFKHGWIPESYYITRVMPVLHGLYGAASNIKPLNRFFFPVPEFPDIGSFVNGRFLNSEHKIVSDKSIRDELFRNGGRVVFKLDHSAKGKAIHFFDEKSFEPDVIRRLGNGLFQQEILQHPSLAEFAPTSTATLRIVTVVDDNGEIDVRACYLRLGTGTDTHVKSDTSTRVQIDVDSGELHDFGYTASWERCKEHPTSKIAFRGRTIPEYQACVEAAKKCHEMVPFVGCVGWDVVVDTSNRVRIMEWQADNAISFLEATQGPCFADLGWDRFRNVRPELVYDFTSRWVSRQNP